MKSLVIFDLDGTLLNTIDDLGTACNHTLALHGYPTHHISSYPHLVGNGISKLIERALPSDEASPENVARLREDFTAFYDLHNADMTRPYPGIPQLLDNLTELGVAVAVASNKYQTAAETVVRHYFPAVPWIAVEGQKPDVPVKPDPSVVFSILADHPTPKTEVLYVGDSAVDMETAHRAGVESCGVTWGFRSVRELTEALADHIVDTPAQILALTQTPTL